MHGRYTRIHPKQIKSCNKCGGEIFFVKNRNDKWFPVSVVYPGEGQHRYPAYKHSAGAYSNMIPWHVCQPKRDYVGENLVKQAQRVGLCVAQRALAAFRSNPDDEQTQLALAAIQERISIRIQRRINALPDASKAWVR